MAETEYDYFIVFCRRGDLGELVDRQPVCMVDLVLTKEERGA